MTKSLQSLRNGMISGIPLEAFTRLLSWNLVPVQHTKILQNVFGVAARSGTSWDFKMFKETF